MDQSTAIWVMQLILENNYLREELKISSKELNNAASYLEKSDMKEILE